MRNINEKVLVCKEYYMRCFKILGVESKRSVQFDEEVRVEKIVKEEVEINECKMDNLLHYLHDADPTDPQRDPPEMKDLAGMS